MNKFEVFRQRLVSLARISEEMIDDIEISRDNYLGEILVRMTRDVWAHKLGERTVRYPADWREAFKDRWFPSWLKHRFPVRYKEHDALVIFPEFKKHFPIPPDACKQNFYFTYMDHKENPYRDEKL